MDDNANRTRHHLWCRRDVVSEAIVHLTTAGAAFESGSMPEARAAIDLALQEATSWPERGRVLHGAGYIYLHDGDPVAAADYWRTFISESRVEDTTGISPATTAAAWYYLGLSLRQTCGYAEAVVAYEEAAARYRTLQDEPALCQVLQNQAWAMCLAGSYGMAMVALAEAAMYVQTVEDRWHQRVGLIHAASGSGWYDSKAAVEAAEQLAADETASLDVRCQAAWVAATTYLKAGVRDPVGPLVDLTTSLADQCGSRRIRRDADQLAERFRATQTA